MGLTPETAAAIFAGLNALVMVYLSARKDRRVEVREDLDDARDEIRRLEGRLAACEQDRDGWRERYYDHLEGDLAQAGRPGSDRAGEGG